jgi:integrative and conjugative element protein (TIGR02256 family)
VFQVVTQFKNQCGGLLQISRTVIDHFHSNRQTAADSCEAGGMLLGRVLLNEVDVIIDRATGPTHEDRASRFSFFRPFWLAQKIVNDAWKRSRGTQVYLGEWHTHPEAIPQPSGTDLANWQNIRSRSKHAVDELIFAIVGIEATRVWSIRKGCNDLAELVRVPTD